MYFSYYLSSFKTTFEFFILVALAIVTFVALYEVGYLENDIQAIDKEMEPTMRIYQQDKQFFFDNYKKIIYSRYIFVFLILMIFLYISYCDIFELNIFLYMFFLIMTRFIFYLHNYVEGRSRIASFGLLQVFKYLSVPILFLQIQTFFMAIVFLVLIFPLVRTMEYASSEKFNFTKYRELIGNHDLFRMKYYMLLFILSMALYYTYSDKNMILLVYVTSYFLIYRVGSYILVISQIYKRKS